MTDNLLHPKDDKELREEIAELDKVICGECRVGSYLECSFRFKDYIMLCPREVDQILSISLLDQYVKLDDDQNLPSTRLDHSYNDTQRTMLKAGFRKVQLKGE